MNYYHDDNDDIGEENRIGNIYYSHNIRQNNNKS